MAREHHLLLSLSVLILGGSARPARAGYRSQAPDKSSPAPAVATALNVRTAAVPTALSGSGAAQVLGEGADAGKPPRSANAQKPAEAANPEAAASAEDSPDQTGAPDAGLALFDGGPAIVKEGVAAYLRQLTPQDRKAVLDQLQPAPGAQAFKRFLEATGNDRLGRFLASRRDLLPEAFRAGIEGAESPARASDFAEVQATIESELGAPISQLFREINQKPVKAGAIVDVYEAVLADGRRAVVRVVTSAKRQAALERVERLRQVVGELEGAKDRLGHKTALTGIFAQYDQVVAEELDLRRQHDNAVDLAKALPKDIAAASTVNGLARKSVQVQAFVDGLNPIELPLDKRRAVLDKLIGMYIDQLLNKTTYHESPTPDHIRVDAKGRLTFLHTGLVGRVSEDDRSKIMPLIKSARAPDVDTIVKGLQLVGARTPAYDEAGLKAGIAKVIAVKRPPNEMVSAILYEAGSHGIDVKPACLQLVHSMAVFERTIYALDPAYDLEKQLMKRVLAALAKKAFGKLFGR